MKKASVIITVCAGVAFIVAFGQYVHRGYMAVVGHDERMRLLDHGFHLRAPWNRVTIYPVQCRAIHLEMIERVSWPIFEERKRRYGKGVRP